MEELSAATEGLNSDCWLVDENRPELAGLLYAFGFCSFGVRGPNHPNFIQNHALLFAQFDRIWIFSRGWPATYALEPTRRVYGLMISES